MKLLSNVVKFAVFCFMFTGPFLAHSQSAATPAAPADKKAAKLAAIKDLVESQNYTFRVTTALPLSGRAVQLTSEYSVKVSKESIISDLPYFGRAYAAPIDPTKGGLQYTSKDFDYTLTPGKKDGWNVMIKPKDNKDVQQMTLNISSTGYGTAQVISVNRQPISFNGEIVMPGKK